MTSRSDCPDVRLMLPELALGSVTGQDRARALKHLAGCPECRRELSALSEVSDELLLLAPPAEPPVGFESRVMESLGGSRHRAVVGWRRGAAAAAAIVIAALGGGAAVYVAGASDRELADSYRNTLAVADGEYFGARPLRNETGAAVGHVFGYQGSPSWVFCLVRSGRAHGTYDIQVSVRSGDTWTAGDMEVPEGKSATWAQSLPVDLHDVAKITLLERSSGERLVATW